MTKVAYTPAATKELRKLSRKEAARIMAKLAQLAADPAALAPQVKALQGTGPKAYRLRVGDYRAIFRPQGSGLLVLRVANRREVYR